MRYDVYQAAIDAINLLLRTRKEEREDIDAEVTRLLVKIDEARFFFPEREVAIFRDIAELITYYQILRAEWRRSRAKNEDSSQIHRELLDTSGKLVKHRDGLPERLTTELGFGQLTTRT